MGFSSGKYIKFQTAICCVNLIVLTLGIIIFAMDFGTYGNVIYQETQEWNQNVVTDFIMVNDYESCPAGYEVVYSRHPGTETYCDKLIGYSHGSCTEDESGITKYGLSQTDLYIFDERKMCFKRGNVNYHQIYNSRLENAQFDSCFSGELECGPNDFTEGYTYCYSGDTCPLNALSILPEGQTDPSLEGLGYREEEFFGNWDGFLIYNESSAPIVNFYINIAPPCGELDSLYTPRDGPSRLYEEGNCGFKFNDSPYHPEFIPTGFTQTEYDVLSDNDYLDDVLKKVPDAETSDMTSNVYELYYKPYAKWSLSCSRYSTEYIGLQGEQIKLAVKSTKAVFIISLIQIIQFCLLYFLMHGFKKEGQKDNLKMTALISLGISLLLYISINFTLLRIVKRAGAIDEISLQDYAFANCSDEILNYSFQQVVDSIGSLQVLSIIAFILTLGLMVADILSVLICFKILKLFKTKKERSGHDLEEELLRQDQEREQEQLRGNQIE